MENASKANVYAILIITVKIAQLSLSLF